MVPNPVPKPKSDPCSVCSKAVSIRSKSIACDFCHTWVHCKCDSEFPLDLYERFRDKPTAALRYCCLICRSQTKLTQKLITPLIDASSQTKSESSLSYNGQTTQFLSPTNIISERLSDKSSDTATTYAAVVENNKLVSPLEKHTVDKCGNSTTKTNTPPQVCNHGTNTPRINAYPDFPRKNLIVYNVPECTSPSLGERAAHDLREWNDLCNLLGVPIPDTPILCRLRLQNKVVVNQIRPLRVTMASADCVEATLLAASSLTYTNSKLRIKPDFPWAVRQARRAPAADSSTEHYDRSDRKSVV